MANSVAPVIVRDSFTRANSGTLGANWTAESDAIDTVVIGIVSNAAQPAVGGNSASFWSANTFSANHYSEVILGGSALGGGSHGGGPIVRASAGGNYYRFFANLSNAASNLQIAKNVNGSFTSLGLATVTLALGDLLRLEAVGSTITAYRNGTQVLQVTDTDLSTGSPGICAFMAAASPTGFMTNWEGGNLIWTRKGTVIPIGSGGGTQEPSVLYDTNPQILSANPDGKIWKMWFTNGWLSPPATIYYAESADGITWTQYSSNPVISDASNACLHHFVFRNGNTYYAYVGNDLAAGTGTTVQLDQWTSSNGIAWTKAHAAVLSIGGAGAWDHLTVADPVVWIQSGTWYMLYQGRSASIYSVGLATSPDGVTWTKYASNPVITGTGDSLNGKTITQLGGIYYLWGGTSPSGANIPTDISMWSSPDLHTWTPNTQNPIYERVLADEGANLSVGQVADACVVELNGTSYLFYDATNAQTSGHIHINMATAPLTIAQLLGIYFGASGGPNNAALFNSTLGFFIGALAGSRR